ncbi:unnamed protein product [Effrenium voratum]|nr:unnamed protein product [Effrenium voratum]
MMRLMWAAWVLLCLPLARAQAAASCLEAEEANLVDVSFLQVDIGHGLEVNATHQKRYPLPGELILAVLHEVTVERLRTFLLFCMVVVIAQMFAVMLLSPLAKKRRANMEPAVPRRGTYQRAQPPRPASSSFGPLQR